MSKVIWDFDTINEMVPIEDVLAFHGIYPIQGKYRIREDDDTPSASIHPQKKYGNTVHDFGFGNNFNPLTLTMYLQGVDMVEASRILGEAFQVPPKFTSREGADSADKISDYEWKMLGIYPDIVSKNIDFDLEKYGVSSSMKLSERYKMSMSELREQVTGPNAVNADDRDIRRYESILRTKAVPYAYEKRYEYFRRMYDDYQLAKAVNSEMEIDKIYLIHQSDYEAMAKSLSRIELAIKKVLEGTSLKFKGRRYSPAQDFASVLKGEVSFEIGLSSHFEVSKNAFQDKTKVFYCVVNLDEYYKLLGNGLDKIQVAARQKGEQVSLSFLSTDASKVHNLVKALRGKEAILAESLGEALVGYDGEKKDMVVSSPIEPSGVRQNVDGRVADSGVNKIVGPDEAQERSDGRSFEHKAGDR